MVDDLTPHDEIMMESLYWWGIPTLFRCPVIKDPAECDIALVGVPHSTGNGTTERDQHLGPRAVRDVSALARRCHGPFQLDPWNTCRIADLGDVPFPEANDNEKCIERITQFLRKLTEREFDQSPSVVTIQSQVAFYRPLVARTPTFPKGERLPFFISTPTQIHLNKFRISSGHTNQQRTGLPILFETVTWMRRAAYNWAFVGIHGHLTGLRQATISGMRLLTSIAIMNSAQKRR